MNGFSCTPNFQALNLGKSKKEKKPFKPCQYQQSKVAFEIPSIYKVEGFIPEKLVDLLMDKFDDSEFMPEDLCNDDLLIVSTDKVPGCDWIADARHKIDKVLKGWSKLDT